MPCSINPMIVALINMIVHPRTRDFSHPAIAHAVWLYFRLPRSLRMADELFRERDVVVSCKSIRLQGHEVWPAMLVALDTKLQAPGRQRRIGHDCDKGNSPARESLTLHRRNIRHSLSRRALPVFPRRWHPLDSDASSHAFC
jgi:hypothetical protein